MLIASSISKEKINELPIVQFEGHRIIIDKDSNVKPAIDYLKRYDVIGFDTETRPSFKKGLTNKVALVQLSTDDTCFLFRLNKIGFRNELKMLLQNTRIKKIGLSSHDDILSLKKRENFRPANFIELQKFVKNYGIKDNGLQKIYAILFGMKISKSQRLTNWEAETLTNKQEIYAATDAWTTLRIFKRLNKFPPNEINIAKPIDNTYTKIVASK